MEYVRHVTRDAVADYVAAGTTFVGLVERIETVDRADRKHVLGDLAIALADLYSADGRLPSPELSNDDSFVPGEEIGTERFFRTMGDLAQVFAARDDFYWGGVSTGGTSASRRPTRSSTSCLISRTTWPRPTSM